MGKSRNKSPLTAEEEEEKRQRTLAHQLAANKYDKIIKENTPDSIPRIIEIATQLRMISWENYPHEVQYTLERRPDFLKKVVEPDGQTTIWHGEYQVPDEKKMIFRLLVYCGLFKRNEGDILVRQFVIYLGSEPPVMQTEINQPNLFFRFQLIALIDIPYNLFLESGKPQEAILAMLSNFQGEQPEKVLKKVIQTIVKNTENDLDKQKHLQQLQVMGQLRNFEQIIDKVMESESLQEYVSIERTWFYKQGVKAAEAKAEAKAEARYQKEEAARLRQEDARRKEEDIRRKEEEARRKEEEARRKDAEQRRTVAEQRQHDLEKKQEALIAALLLNNTMAKEKIALIADVELQVVEGLVVKIDKIHKLLISNDLTMEEIALVTQFPVDLVKIVAESSNTSAIKI